MERELLLELIKMMEVVLIQGMYVFIVLEWYYWVQLGRDIDGDATYGFAGTSVALSGQGRLQSLLGLCNSGSRRACACL